MVRIELAAGERPAIVHAADPPRQTVWFTYVLQEYAGRSGGVLSSPQVRHYAAIRIIDKLPADIIALRITKAFLSEIEHECRRTDIKKSSEAENVKAG